MQHIIHQYQILKAHIANLIAISGYRNDYLAKKMGIKPNNFSVKKQRDTWTEKEIEKLLQFIENEETENYLMLELMRAAKKEETVSYEEFKKQVGWK